MKEQIAQLTKQLANYVVSDETPLSHFKKKFIHKQGAVGKLFLLIKEMPLEERKELGRELNKLKKEAEAKYKAWLQEEGTVTDTTTLQDITLPPVSPRLGSTHPLRQVTSKIIKILNKIGFSIAEGPEIEDEWHNFTALNFPPSHPAREMQDTFFLQQDINQALRTHTSSVQIRTMEVQKPPIRIISPGRVFRNETISARSHCMFHQIEGLYIDQGVSFADLKETLYYFLHALFGEDIQIRLRPSYFPFTEPSAEIDISCLLCKGIGCHICKKSGWVEIGGAGMVDPNVLENCNISSTEYSGFAFGMGIERIAMLLAEIPDVRLFTENDIRFLEQHLFTN